ncbi:Glycosyltransferase involved in cell wall bisynthesis [Fictibacillus enclensis]|uniref:Glycosyl transferase family 1 domain-containing protein n=1 Tax=Fictibacillus enclensis TaxID=1017270 RepID=A0A0V8J4R4_9BACL|nr:glycosyltransferase family 4 protein [Fictibacillus enclensis]KSU82079.1 hypothetical protein AS030_17565 [Fictibacillus enclensis]SCC30013.1 Glycosyltransferase involved in cell wall bisynthesis [Fictibacillus enclensis]
MGKGRVLIIGQFPPPVHGLSAALQTIVESNYMNDKYLLQYIDIQNNRRFFNHIRNIQKKYEADLYYFTISQSLFGNIRDMIILRTLLNKKKKVIIHYHGGYYKTLYGKMNILQKKINKSLISKIDTMVALSEGLKKLFVDVISPEKVKVCENYVENSSISHETEFNQKINSLISKPKLNVLYLSNFIKTKGYMDVLKAASNLKDNSFVFHFAGAFFNEEDKKEFFNFVNKNDLQNIVEYHGVVKGDKKKHLLMLADIFTLPTYYPNEGQPISIIEAMSNGLTIITTHHAGIPDIVNENNGFIVDPMSPSAISNCLDQLVKNREKLVDFAKNNRKVVLENYQEEHYIKRLDKIFDEALEG